MFSVAGSKHSSGRGTAVGWLVCLSRWVPPLLGQALRFVPGLQELAAGAQGCQGGGRHGRAAVGGGTPRDGDGDGTAAEGLLSASPELEGSSDRGGKWSSPPSLPSPAAAA